jgi:hypothetical protein
MPEARHHTAILALLALVAAAAIALFVRSRGGGAEAPLGVPSPVVEPPPAPEAPAEPRAAAAAPAGIAVRSLDDDLRAARPAGPPPDAGVLDVRVTPSARIAARFRGGTLSIEELVNPDSLARDPERRPFARVVGFEAEVQQSPTYVVVEGIPFSPYGYRVTLFVQGLNGSSQIVRVAEDSWNPQVDLTVTPPSTFTLRLVDQELEPYVNEIVTLIPVGLPRGRPLVEAETDRFGSAFFEAILAGDYEVKIAHDVRDTVTIERPGFVRDDLDIGVQSKQLQIPRGAELKVEVFDVIQYGLGGVQVRAIALDTTRNRRYEDETDVNGVCLFTHMVPGRYQVDVMARGYQQTSRSITIEAGKPVAPLQFRLPRLH